MAKGAPLKDLFFNATKVGDLAARFRAVDPGFDPEFEARVLGRFPELELKQRMAWIAECLAPALPSDFAHAAEIIEAALPPPLDPTRRDGDFGDFIYAPLGEYAVAHGLEHHRDRTLDLLEALTQRFSMEYAIRHVINRWPDDSYARFEVWAHHPSYHVRRLVSEGTRPRLPWGIGITTPIARALPLLDRLCEDDARFVTRSVANHMNDISKVDADAVLQRLDCWQAEARRKEEVAWLTRHALRGLIKAGHPQAFALLGYDPEATLTAELTLASPIIRIGEALDMAITLTAPETCVVLIDYILEFHRPSGRPGRKVFKLRQGRVAPDAPLTLSKQHMMRGDATTFRLHPGPHRLYLQINGKIRDSAGFELTAA
ncbi:hypothetical protein [Pseudooceanicola sp.]|uniref:hypothetical protein n=1 Tax=Pseudooceanicola sp. TaxID=1914328 RepID=UPI0040594979